MGIGRSTFYDMPDARVLDLTIVAEMKTICDEFEAYGWRRVQVPLRHQGVIANHKRIKRLMREHDFQPRRRGCYVATTDSNYDQPIFSDRSKDIILDGPDQLWVADPTYVAISGNFLCGDYPGCLVTPRRRLCDRQVDRRAARARRAEGSDRATALSTRMHSSFRPRIAIRIWYLSGIVGVP